MNTKNIHAKNDVKTLLENFLSRVTPNERYASYDYCFRYFQANRHQLSQNMEISCLHLWSYLASWGMLRGSSKLLTECSMKVLSDVIKYLDSLPDEDWDLDIEDYTNENKCCRILDIYKEISSRIAKIRIGSSNNIIGVNATPTLVTKIMLGTLGCVPAFDEYFSEALTKEFSNAQPHCGFCTLTLQSMKYIYDLYDANRNVFDTLKINVMDFNGKPIDGLFYRKIKLIDMYGWSVGRTI